MIVFHPGETNYLACSTLPMNVWWVSVYNLEHPYSLFSTFCGSPFRSQSIIWRYSSLVFTDLLNRYPSYFAVLMCLHLFVPCKHCVTFGILDGILPKSHQYISYVVTCLIVRSPSHIPYLCIPNYQIDTLPVSLLAGCTSPLLCSYW